MSLNQPTEDTSSFRTLLVMAATISISLGGATALEAQAHCHCKVQCAFPHAANFTEQPSWQKRPNGKNFNWPHSKTEWDECKDYCRNYVFGLDLHGMAQDRTSCGTVECTSSYWLGARPERTGELRQLQIECPPPPTDFHYAVKFACGAADTGTFLHPGDYRTVVNVHNPGPTPAEARHKVALADLREDGLISGFATFKIGSDGAQYYDCDYFRALAGVPGLIDGFFVIESPSELDVAAYYTSSEMTLVNAIHLERYPGRQVPRCKKELKVDLSNPLSWTTTNGPALGVSPVPIYWDQNRNWMSYSHTGAISGGPHPYQIDFCCCLGGTVTITGDIKSDNNSTGTLLGANTTELFKVPGSGNFDHADAELPFSLRPTSCRGPGAISIIVHNSGEPLSLPVQRNPSGLSVVGTLTLSDAFVGECETL